MDAAESYSGAQGVDEPGVEWTLLEAVTAGVHDPSQRDRLSRLVHNKDFDWDAVLLHATHHGLAPLLASETQQQHLAALIPSEARSFINSETPHGHKRATRHGYGTRGQCSSSSRWRCSSSLHQGYYPPRLCISEERCPRDGDADLLVCPQERKIVKEAMYELGYRYGRFDSRTGAIQDSLHLTRNSHSAMEAWARSGGLGAAAPSSGR